MSELQDGMTEIVDDTNNGLDVGADDESADVIVDDGQNEGTEDGKQDAENEIYGSPETFDYSEIELPENMVLDSEMVEKFNPIAKKFNLSNKSASELMALAVEHTQKNMAKFADEFSAQYQDAEKKSYLQLLNTDKELNAYSDEDYSQYLSVANLGIKSVATQGFKDLILQKGLTQHPDFIKTFHAIGKLCQTDKLPDVKNPVGSTQSAADILYGSPES